MFVCGNHFNSSLIFAKKVSAYPKSLAHQGRLQPYPKILDWEEVLHKFMQLQISCHSKLACFIVTHFNPCLIFAGKAGNLPVE